MAWDFDNRETSASAATAALYPPSNCVAAARGPEVDNAPGPGSTDNTARGKGWGADGLGREDSAASAAGSVGVEREMGDGEHVGAPLTAPETSARVQIGTRIGTATVPETASLERAAAPCLVTGGTQLRHNRKSDETSQRGASAMPERAATVATTASEGAVTPCSISSGRKLRHSRSGDGGFQCGLPRRLEGEQSLSPAPAVAAVAASVFPAGSNTSPIECGASPSGRMTCGGSRSHTEIVESPGGSRLSADMDQDEEIEAPTTTSIRAAGAGDSKPRNNSPKASLHSPSPASEKDKRPDANDSRNDTGASLTEEGRRGLSLGDYARASPIEKASAVYSVDSDARNTDDIFLEKASTAFEVRPTAVGAAAASDGAPNALEVPPAAAGATVNHGTPKALDVHRTAADTDGVDGSGGGSGASKPLQVNPTASGAAANGGASSPVPPSSGAADTNASITMRGTGKRKDGTTGGQDHKGDRAGGENVNADISTPAAVAPAGELVQGRRERGAGEGQQGVNSNTDTQNVPAAGAGAEALVQGRREDGEGKGEKGADADKPIADEVAPAEEAFVQDRRGEHGAIKGEKGVCDTVCNTDTAVAPAEAFAQNRRGEGGAGKGKKGVNTDENASFSRAHAPPSAQQHREDEIVVAAAALHHGNPGSSSPSPVPVGEARQGESPGLTVFPSSDDDDPLGGPGRGPLDGARIPGFENRFGDHGDDKRGIDDDSGKGDLEGDTSACSGGEKQKRRRGPGSDRRQDSKRGETGRGGGPSNNVSPSASVSSSHGGLGGEKSGRKEEDAVGAAATDAAEIVQSRSIVDSSKSSFDGVSRQDANGDDDGNHGREFDDPAEAVQARGSAPPPATPADDDSDIASEIGGGSGDGGSDGEGGARLATDSVREEQSLGDGDEYGSDFASQVGELQLLYSRIAKTTDPTPMF